MWFIWISIGANEWGKKLYRDVKYPQLKTPFNMNWILNEQTHTYTYVDNISLTLDGKYGFRNGPMWGGKGLILTGFAALHN